MLENFNLQEVEVKRRHFINFSFRKVRGRLIGYSSAGLFGLILLAMIFPMVNNDVSAEGEALTNATSLKAATYVYSTLAVSLSDSVNLDVTPKASGSFASGEAELKVTTNNTTGYQVYMQTGDNTSSLKPANGMVQSEIGPVVGEMTASNFASNLNTWGYAVAESGASTSNLSYRAIPSSSEPAIITTDKLTAEDSYILGFATAVGADLPAGQYYNSVLVSVVANPIAVHTLSGITYMQEMSPYVCDYSDEEETKQLIDTRDGKSYWVAKLKDDNCWMTQNLALDLDINENGNAVAVSESGNKVELNNSNTDITSVWHEYAPSRTETDVPKKTTVNYVLARSWNLGKVVLVNPTNRDSCSDIAAESPITTCQYYIDVSGWSDSYKATTISSINSEDNTYDAHYLIGNYYSLAAVTAGSSAGVTSPSDFATNPHKLVDFPDSICPKGWKLPTSGNNTALTAGWPFDREDSFYKLLRAYGYPATGSLNDLSSPVNGWNANEGYAFTSISGTGIARMDYSPIYLVRSGAIRSSLGILYRLAIYGNYWSSTASTSDANSFYLYFDRDGIVPSSIVSRADGNSVRCLAK